MELFWRIAAEVRRELISTAVLPSLDLWPNIVNMQRKKYCEYAEREIVRSQCKESPPRSNPIANSSRWSPFNAVPNTKDHNRGISFDFAHSLSQSPKPAVVYFFSVSALFCTVIAKLWPISANLGYFVANLRPFWCTFTGLNNAVVSQNWQISVMTLASFTSKCQMPKCKERPRRSNPITNSSRW